jgi:hypothetical protein
MRSCIRCAAALSRRGQDRASSTCKTDARRCVEEVEERSPSKRREFGRGSGHLPARSWWLRINKQRLREWDPERPLQQQSAAFKRHHQALIAALSAMQQRRDEALRQSDPPDPQRAVLTGLKTHWAGPSVFVTHPRGPHGQQYRRAGVRKGVPGRNAYHGSGGQ